MASVPSNFIGYQLPHSGHAFAGIGVYSVHNPPNNREYIQVSLLDSLQAGHQYCVDFYVNLAVDNSYTYAIDRIGLLFSTTPITSTNYYYFNYSPQITSPPGVFLTDTLGWTQVTGLYTSTGGERYITIGNFRTDVTTDTIKVASSFQKAAYYNIDDVSIYECPTGIQEDAFVQTYSVLPNPITDQAIVQFVNSKKEHCTLTLINPQGQISQIISNISSDKVIIRRHELTKGLYQFIIRGNHGLLVTGKLVVD